jgi:hypothetical protein
MKNFPIYKMLNSSVNQSFDQIQIKLNSSDIFFQNVRRYNNSQFNGHHILREKIAKGRIPMHCPFRFEFRFKIFCKWVLLWGLNF